MIYWHKTEVFILFFPPGHVHCLVLRCLQPNRHLLRVQILEDHLQRVFIQLPLASFISWCVHLFCDILPPDQVDRSVGVGQDRLDCLSWAFNFHLTPEKASQSTFETFMRWKFTDSLFSPGDNICQTNHLCRLDQGEEAHLWSYDNVINQDLKTHQSLSLNFVQANLWLLILKVPLIKDISPMLWISRSK